METSLQASSAPFLASQFPTIRIANEYRYTLGDECIALNHMLGIDLLEWQKNVVRDFLAVDAHGQFIHRRCCLSVPRQSGKSFLTIAIVNYLILKLHFRCAFTAHNYSTVGDIFDRFKRMYGYRANDPNCPNRDLNEMVKNVRGATSREAVELHHVKTQDGEFDPCCAFSTRTDSSLRGQSFDCLLLDESQELSQSQLSSVLPTTNSGPAGNSIVIYLGTPETPDSRGEIFGNIRKNALSGDADDICWLEWSVDEIGDINDKARWYATNPSLGILSNDSVLKAAAGSMHPFAFAQEYLGYWPKNSVATVIDYEKWKRCATTTPPMDGSLSYAVKFSSDGSTGAIAVCLRPKDGLPHVEIVDVRPMSKGLSWFADWLECRAENAAAITVDGMSNAQPLIDELIRRGVRKRIIRKPKSADMSAACSMLLNSVVEGKFTHYDQDGLNTAASTCSRRSIGSGGGWGFDGDGAILLESAALALWAANDKKLNPNRKSRVAF